MVTGMPRPRRYSPDDVLDAVESLVMSAGPAAATIRAISDTVGVSNGALYHTFGSRSGLLSRAWLRAARRFLDLQRELVGSVRPGDEGIVAAAQAPAAFTECHPASAHLVLRVSRDEVIDTADADLQQLQTALIDFMIELATAAWDRRDRAAVDTVTTCIVDLPTAILLNRNRITSSTARDHLTAAVRAVLAIGPPPPPKGTS